MTVVKTVAVLGCLTIYAQTARLKMVSHKPRTTTSVKRVMPGIPGQRTVHGADHLPLRMHKRHA